jgi:hypothetical protein
MKPNPLQHIAIAAFIVVVCSPAHANLAGVNFSGPVTEQSTQSLASIDSAGFFPQKFWNNAPGLNGQTGIEIDGGTTIPVYYSGFTAQWQSSASGSSPTAAVLPNSKLMKGSLLATRTEPVLVQLSGIPLSFTGLGYALAVYCDSPGNPADVIIKATLQLPGGNRTSYLRDIANENFSGDFLRGPLNSSTDAAQQTPTGNLFVLTGLSAADLALAIEPAPSNPAAVAAVNAVQLIPASMVQTLAPRIISPLQASANLSQSFSYQVETDFPATSFAGIGLPPGLALNPTNGLLSGVPLQSGVYLVSVTVGNSRGTTTDTFKLTVVGPEPAHLDMRLVPAVLVHGAIGQTHLIEYRNALEETEEWRISGTVTLTNQAQFYLDPEGFQQPRRFYRATLQP